MEEAQSQSGARRLLASPGSPLCTWEKPGEKARGSAGRWPAPAPPRPDLQLPDHFLQLLAAALAQCGLGVEVRALDPGHHLLEQEALRVLKAESIQQLPELRPGTGVGGFWAASPAAAGRGEGKGAGLTGRRLASKGSSTGAPAPPRGTPGSRPGAAAAPASQTASASRPERRGSDTAARGLGRGGAARGTRGSPGGWGAGPG